MRTPQPSGGANRAAAQTASIGNQDMMTFMPADSSGAPGTSSRESSTSSLDAILNAGGGGGGGFASVPPGQAPGCVIPTTVGDPLLLRGGACSTFLDRGESMDDEAFNASLDALLRHDDQIDDLAESLGLGGENSLGVGGGGGGGGRKRRRHGEITTCQQQQQQQGQGGGEATVTTSQQQSSSLTQRLYGGVGGLPPMFASQPISVSGTNRSSAFSVQGGQTQQGTTTRGVGEEQPSLSLVCNPSQLLGNNPLINSGGAQQVGDGGWAPGTAGGLNGQPHPPTTHTTAQHQVVTANQGQPFQVASMTAPPPPQQQQQQQHHNQNTHHHHHTPGRQQDDLMAQIANLQSSDLFPAFQLGGGGGPHTGGGGASSSHPWDDAAMAAAAAAGDLQHILFPSQVTLPHAQVTTAQSSSQEAVKSWASAVPGQTVPHAVSTTPSATMAAAAAKKQPAHYSQNAMAQQQPSSTASSTTANNNGKRMRSTPGSQSQASIQGQHQHHQPPVSEDESERLKRRSERNAREQERSHKITERISELRQVLSEAGMHFKPDRYSTLVGVVDYVKMLQGRSRTLDEEHRKLLDTISTADQLANSSKGGGGMTSATTTTVQTHDSIPNSVPAGSSSVAASSANISLANNSNDDEFSNFVRGIDYKSIFACCGVALAVASVDGRFVDCNDEFLRITEYTRRELLGEDGEGTKRVRFPSPQCGQLTARLQGGVEPPLADRLISRLGGQRRGQVVTISTSTSANPSSSLLTTAAEAGHAAHLHRSKTPDSPLSTAAGNGGNKEGNSTSPPSPAIPTEIQMRKPHHLSLFNLLGGEDMEAVYTAMSRMLQREVVGTVSAPKNAIVSSMCRRSKGNDSSSSSGESFVKSDLTRSTEEYSGTSSGNDVSNTEGEGGSSGSQGGSSGGGSPNPEEGDGGSSGNGSGGTGGSKRQCTVDHWTGSVKHNRRKNQMLQLNISLVRTVDGRPKFFNCALSEAE